MIVQRAHLNVHRREFTRLADACANISSNVSSSCNSIDLNSPIGELSPDENFTRIVWDVSIDFKNRERDFALVASSSIAAHR